MLASLTPGLSGLLKLSGSITLRPKAFVAEVLKDLPNHERNENIPLDFRKQIPAITADFKRLESLQTEAEVADGLKAIMTGIYKRIDALDVEGQIYLNMLYKVSTYNNMVYDLSFEFSRCVGLLRCEMTLREPQIIFLHKAFMEFKEDKNSELTLGSQLAMQIIKKGFASIERS